MSVLRPDWPFIAAHGTGLWRFPFMFTMRLRVFEPVSTLSLRLCVRSGVCGEAVGVWRESALRLPTGGWSSHYVGSWLLDSSARIRVPMASGCPDLIGGTCCVAIGVRPKSAMRHAVRRILSREEDYRTRPNHVRKRRALRNVACPAFWLVLPSGVPRYCVRRVPLAWLFESPPPSAVPPLFCGR